MFFVACFFGSLVLFFMSAVVGSILKDYDEDAPKPFTALATVSLIVALFSALPAFIQMFYNFLS